MLCFQRAENLHMFDFIFILCQLTLKLSNMTVAVLLIRIWSSAPSFILKLFYFQIQDIETITTAASVYFSNGNENCASSFHNTNKKCGTHIEYENLVIKYGVKEVYTAIFVLKMEKCVSNIIRDSFKIGMKELLFFYFH